MPTYVYRREDGTSFEIQQRITEDALETCPETGQKVTRVISGAGLIFKGSGFYLTDYARKNGNGSSEKSEAGGNGSDKSAESKSSETKSSESKSSESKSSESKPAKSSPSSD